MSTYTATVRWHRTGDGDFTKGQYGRAHEWTFDGGVTVPASASPHVVPAPWSDPQGIDPEEAFIASLSSCHMLFFIDYARRDGWIIDTYHDDAQGRMEKRADGKIAVTKVTLRPKIEWAGAEPTADQVAQLHHRSHEDCFIANSVNCEVTIEQ